jgi:nucleotide-binding universal stress UspA family protein
MPMESLVVFLEADREQANIVQVAADVADRFGSSITGLSALGIRPPFVAEGVVIDVGGEEEIEKMEASLAIRKDWFARVAKDRGHATDWRSGFESPTARLVREAAGADLIIASPTSETGDRYRRPDVAEAILRAGRPFLIVPDRVGTLNAERIVVGWKNTREARRAVADALPFLVRASEVTIVEVCERKDFQQAFSEVEELGRYLSKHRVKSCYERVVWSDKPVGQKLLAVARQSQADLIVTGAYGHTRLGEWMFGGVTRDLLVSGDLCCLMSH